MGWVAGFPVIIMQVSFQIELNWNYQLELSLAKWLPGALRNGQKVLKGVYSKRNVRCAMWLTQCDKSIVTNVIWQTQRDKLNVTNTTWETKSEKRNVTNTMWLMQPNTRNLTNTPKQTQPDNKTNLTNAIWLTQLDQCNVTWNSWDSPPDKNCFYCEQRCLERGPTLGYWTLRSTFAK